MGGRLHALAISARCYLYWPSDRSIPHRMLYKTYIPASWWRARFVSGEIRGAMNKRESAYSLGMVRDRHPGLCSVNSSFWFTLYSGSLEKAWKLNALQVQLGTPFNKKHGTEIGCPLCNNLRDFSKNNDVRGHISWPPRLSDLSAYDFFLWGYLKRRVFQTSSADL